MNLTTPFAILGMGLAALSQASLPPVQSSPSGKVKVFILAGQSNMEGHAVVDLTGKDYNEGKGTLATLLSDPQKAPIFQHLRQKSGTWTVRNDVFVRYQRQGEPLLKGPLGFGFSVYGDQHHFGPELQFGHIVGDKFKEPVLLIKTAWGGKSLYKDFRPPSSGGEVGPFYKLMLSDVRQALQNMNSEFPNLTGLKPELAGLVWYQGWNDGVDPKTAVPQYEKNLINLINDVRKELASPQMPVIVGELTGPWVKAEGGWDALRKAQQAATLHPEFKGNVRFVETHDFVREAEQSPNPTHGHHEFGNAETIFLVGDALGKGMIDLISGKPPKVQKVQKVEPTFSLIKDYGVKNYLRTSKSLPHVEDKPWRLIATMPYNCHFQPIIELESKPGQSVNLNSTNPLVQYLTPTETVTTSGGNQRIEAKNWVSGEGAMYTIPAGVKVKSVQYRETGYNTTFAGSFTCNDTDFNTLWNKAARTAYTCMRDHFYDCPDRERVGFWGDGTPELNQCFYVFDSKAHQLAKELVLRKLEPKFYPGQHLEFLGEYGLWFYYLHTGDLDSIKKIYGQTKTFLFDTYKFGNKGTWFDWGKEVKDTAVTETCFYYNCLQTLRKMAVVTDHLNDVPLIDRKLRAIESTFDSLYWKDGYFMSNQVTSPDDRANAMAVNSGLASRDKWESIFQKVLSQKTYSSCFFDRWVFEAMCKMDKPDQALLRMATRYKTMIPATQTTLWEHYDRWWASYIDAFDEGSSLNHGWNPPALVLSQDITGIRPTEPGWTSFQVLPQEAFLKSIKMVVPTVKGNIPVEIRKDATNYLLALTVPKGTEALVGIPKAAFKSMQSVSLNSQTVWNGNYTNVIKLGQIEGAQGGSDNGNYITFKLSAGTYKLNAKGIVITESPKPQPRVTRNSTPLDKRGWTATASVPDSKFGFSGGNIPIDISAENAIDGDHWNGWRDMTKTQYPGQWLQVDMKKTQTFDKITLDTTWALWDTPEKYEIRVSQDGVNWSEVIASGKGDLGITTISFPTQTSRFIRITQAGSNQKYHWSVYELDVLRSGR